MSLQQSSVLVDRALVTLCTELPESLGLYNTVKDQFNLSAMRSVSNLENLVFESKKHLIIRDWMRSYIPKEDQPLTNEISMDTLKQTLKEEKRKNANIARGMNEDMMPSSSAPASSSSSSKSSSAAHAQKKKDKHDKKDAAKRAAKASGNGKAKAKGTKSRDSRMDRSGKASAKRVRRRGDAGESESESEYDSSTSSGSSTSSSSDSEREEKNSSKGSQSSSGKKKARPTSNLPPVELVLSSDEEDEPNDLFDTEDPDVYEVESILDKRKGRSFGEPDMYLIKWVGYEETTWEPADNVSKDLIEEFEGQPVRENEYIVEEIRDRKSTRDRETKLKTFKYLIKWVGYDDLTWEPAENLPHNLRRKFDQKFEARKRRKTK